MASTNFIPNVTVIEADWLNDVNTVTYGINANVKQFGAVGDGVTDDTAAIQSAFDSGLDIIFPDGNYLVTSQLTINTAGQQITTLQPYSNEFGGANINFTHNGVCILVTQAQVAITNIKFTGTRTGLDTAIKAAKIVNTDDIDFAAINCLFKFCAIGIDVVGRSLTATNNRFANCTTCITLSWPTSGVDPTNPEQDLPLGWRATRILNNRAHSCSLFIDITGASKALFRGALINSNQMDVGERFFRGGIIDSTISNNIVELANSTIMYIDAGGSDLTITGNVFNGTDGDPSQSPARAIWFETTSTPNNVSITGNTISYMDSDCIRFASAASFVSIVGNAFGKSTTSNLSIQNTFSNCSIIGNNFDLQTGTNCINATGATLTGCTIFGNSHSSTKTLIAGAPTDGGANIVQTEGRVNFNSLNLPVRTIEGSTTSSLAMRLTRTGSSFGVGFESVTDGGSIQLFANPSGTNVGSFVPGGDNSISNGLASLRWSVIYAGTGTINTSDEREKQDIEQLSNAEKRVAARLKPLIKKFKFRDAVGLKGDKARIHFGVIAQEVKAAFEAENLNAFDYALLCYDEWAEQQEEIDENGDVVKAYAPAGNRYGIRYEELIMFILGAM